MKSRILTRALLLAAGISVPVAAQTVDEERAERPRLGLSPGAPQVRSVPPTLPFGIESTRADDWVLDFHGYVLVPLNVGLATRAEPTEGQSDIVFHNPPRIPSQDLREFHYTGVVPSTWVQLDFSYGTTLVRGTAIISARQVTNGAGFFTPADQIGLTDAFLSFDLSEPLDEVIEVNAGAFKNRYGAMGEYDLGRYGTPLIAQTNAIGETISAAFEFGSIGLLVEQGFGGSFGTAQGTVPAGWNDFANPDAAPTLVNHLHLGASYAGLVQVGAHYLSAWSSDDRLAGNLLPDGRINVYGGDVRFTLGQYGHLYAGGAFVDLQDARTVSGTIEILNARGGREIIDGYLCPPSDTLRCTDEITGNGSLTTVGAQYDLSVGRLVFPELEGHGPDIFVSLFGMQTDVVSDDQPFYSVTKRKFGAEATYSALSWFGFGARYDNVQPDSFDSAQNFQIISPRILFHTDWNSSDQLVLQYSRFIYGNNVVVENGFPPTPDPRINPDENVVTLSASVWW